MALKTEKSKPDVTPCVLLEMRVYFPRQWDYQMNSTDLQVYFAFAFTVANCTVLLFTLCVGLAANVFVIWAVVHQKSLQTSNNALLVNLAVIDLLRCVVDCPLLLVISFSGYGIGDLGVVLCDAQLLSFSFSCCVQLLTLASISAERYQAIANPFQTKQRRRRIMVSIPVIWTVAILLSVVCIISARDAPVYVKCREIRIDSLPSYDTFGRYILVPVWSGCLAVIIAFYGRIFFIVRMHNRKIFDQGVFPPPKKKAEVAANDGKETAEAKSNKLEEQISKKTENNPEEARKADFSLTALPADPKPPVNTETEELVSAGNPNSSGPANIPLTSQDSTASPPSTGTVKIKRDCEPASPKSPKKESTVVSFEAPTNAPSATEPPVLIDLEGSKADSAPDPKSVDDAKVEVPASPAKEAHITDASANPPAAPDDGEEVAGAVCMMPSLANRERASKNKESKLAKRSGYIILTFLLFWTPLILSVLVNFFVYRQNHPAMEIAWEVEILSVSVACMTSATNPITYAVVNPQFRTEFQNLKAKFKVKMLCSK